MEDWDWESVLKWMSKDCLSGRAKLKDILAMVSELAQRSKGFLPYQTTILVELGEGRGLLGETKNSLLL